MRLFQDGTGRTWEVTLGKESWGTLVLLFGPEDGGEVRKAILASETPLDAQREFDALTDAELAARLTESSPWS